MKADSQYVIWEKGVGSTVSVGSTGDLDRNKTEVLRELTVFLVHGRAEHSRLPDHPPIDDNLHSSPRTIQHPKPTSATPHPLARTSISPFFTVFATQHIVDN